MAGRRAAMGRIEWRGETRVGERKHKSERTIPHDWGLYRELFPATAFLTTLLVTFRNVREEVSFDQSAQEFFSQPQCWRMITQKETFLIIYCIICKSSQFKLHWFVVRIEKFDLFSSWKHDLKNCLLHIIAGVGRVWNPWREFCFLLPRDSPSPQMGEGGRSSPQMGERGRFAQKRSVCLLHPHSTGSTLHSEDHNLSFQAASRSFPGKLETLIVRFSPQPLLAPS